MRTDEIIKKLQKTIRTQLSQKDLVSLCVFISISVSGRKTQLQDRLIEFIQNQSYETLNSMSNKIDEYLRVPTSLRPRQTVTSSRQNVERLTENMLRSAPINLEDEIPPNLRSDLSFPNQSPSMSLGTRLPTHPLQGGIERSTEMPNTMLSTQIATSPFYSCSVCLSPLSLLKPHLTPNSQSTGRISSNYSQNFIITENVKNILSRNLYMSCNKAEYKWQILLRFVGIDPNRMPTNPQEKVSEVIPPYLTVNINSHAQNLWDILPSNSKQKEGKRHAKPVNISDKLNLTNRNSSGYVQSVVLSFWQTPTVFMYYYVGIYLERKLTVKEMMTLYSPNSHFNNRSIEETLKLIQNKLGIAPRTSSKKDDDDDLVISNVLPINLCCPVGKSRITIPLRTVSCQHLQCFDAELFLSMNERRPVWKCPVCDSRATPDDLFRDKFFQKILDTFKDDEDVTDVNVHSDNTFVAMKRNKDREQIENPKINENSAPIHNLDQPEQDLIVLDSDEELDIPLPPKTSSVQPKVTLPSKDIVPPKSNAPQPPPYAAPIAVISDQSLHRVNTAPVNIPINTVEIPTRDIPLTNLNQGNIFSAVTRPNLPTNIICSPSNVPILSSSLLSSSSLSHLSNYVPNLTPPVSRIDSPKTTTQSTIPAPSSSSSSSIRSSNLANSFMTCAITPPNNFNSLSTTTNHSNSPTTTNTFVQTTIPSAFGSPISVIGSKATFVPPVSSDPPISSSKKTTTTTTSNSSELNSFHHKERAAPTRKSIDVEIITSKESANTTPSTTTTTPTQSVQSIIRTPSALATQRTDSSNINGSILNNDIVDDVVRTLPVSNMPDLTSKNRISDNQSPEPIVCPNVIIQLPDNNKKQSRPDSNTSPSPTSPPGQNRKSEIQKKSKFIQSKIPPPAPLVPIPSVTIDLTEEDDEVQQTVPNLKPSSLFGSKTYSWVPVNTPIPSNLNTNGIHHSKNQLNNYNHFLTNKEKENRKLSAMGIGYFKPHQMRFNSNNNNNNNNNNIPCKVNKSNCPIDLTGDDEDEEDDVPIPSKRQKTTNHVDDAEDGQVEDSDEDSSSANYSPPVLANNSSSLNRNVQKNPCHVVSKKKL